MLRFYAREDEKKSAIRKLHEKETCKLGHSERLWTAADSMPWMRSSLLA